MRNSVASIVGIGSSDFSLRAEKSQVSLAAQALRNALEDSGLTRRDIDGVSIHYGAPLGVDYDRLASAFGLELRYVNQAWLNGRFISTALQHAALAVKEGLANVVACVTAVSFARSHDLLAGVTNHEAAREEGGTHGEAPAHGLSGPIGGAALAAQRYMTLYGVDSEKFAAVSMSARAHAAKNPTAIMRRPITLDDYRAAPMIADPLRRFDCCLVSDGAVVVLVTSRERARDLQRKPVDIVGMQGLRGGREEFIFAPRGLGVSTQSSPLAAARAEDLQVFASAGVERKNIQAFYTYDAFSPLVLYALERFGYCPIGGAAEFVQNGRIGPSGDLPVNTSGGLLAEAHVGGWNSIAEMVRQLRGEAGDRQIQDARLLQWGTAWGDLILLSRL